MLATRAQAIAVRAVRGNAMDRRALIWAAASWGLRLSWGLVVGGVEVWVLRLVLGSLVAERGVVVLESGFVRAWESWYVGGEKEKAGV